LFSQRNKQACSWGSPSTGTSFSLISKLALALASVLTYSLIADLADRVEAIESVPETGLWFHYVVGAVFGALVLAPYLGARQRVIRFVLLCAASAVIYWLAVWFVTDGPIGYDAITAFVIAGAGAALLSGLAVVAIAPHTFDMRLVAFTLVAGAIGGAAFDLKFAFDQYLLTGHAAWQILVCLALHFSIRTTPT
jgi:uncharacterized membrane protein YsdA (DUF1294 family)